MEKLAGADVHHLAKIVADRYPPFDIAQNLGLLYHVQNPMLALHQVRSCVRDNGFMLLETAIWRDDNSFPMARFNSDLGIYNDVTTYWAMNYPCLVAMLKMTGWEPDEASSSIVGDCNACRICIICRASKCPEGVDNFGAGLITKSPPA